LRPVQCIRVWCCPHHLSMRELPAAGQCDCSIELRCHGHAHGCSTLRSTFPDHACRASKQLQYRYAERVVIFSSLAWGVQGCERQLGYLCEWNVQLGRMRRRSGGFFGQPLSFWCGVSVGTLGVQWNPSADVHAHRRSHRCGAQSPGGY
jgi:hypothetical protein